MVFFAMHVSYTGVSRFLLSRLIFYVFYLHSLHTLHTLHFIYILLTLYSHFHTFYLHFIYIFLHFNHIITQYIHFVLFTFIQSFNWSLSGFRSSLFSIITLVQCFISWVATTQTVLELLFLGVGEGIASGTVQRVRTVCSCSLLKENWLSVAQQIYWNFLYLVLHTYVFFLIIFIWTKWATKHHLLFSLWGCSKWCL